MGDASEQTAITVQVPLHHVGRLRELLKEHPRLTYFSRGWIVASIAIVGSAQDIAAFRPVLREWQHECWSRDAW